MERFKYTAITQKGRGKNKNEDRLVVDGNFLSGGVLQGETEGPLLAVVCDGVGGEAFGEEAAAIACKSFLPLCGGRPTPVTISGAVIEANKTVALAQKVSPERKSMACTLVGLSIADGGFTVFSAGDSRAYSLRRGALTQLTKDHTQAQALVDGGKISSAAHAPKSMRHTVTRFIGGFAAVRAALGRGRLDEGTSGFLLCSDGLYGKLTAKELAACLCQPGPAMQRCRAALALAVKRGSVDDISIVLVEVEFSNAEMLK